MIAGREFEAHDARRPALPVVIDDLLAQRLVGRDPAVGRTFQIDPGGSGKMSPAEVIGVVRHLRHRSLTDPGREQLFVSARLWARNPASYVLRTSGDPGSLAAAVRAVVADLDPALPVYDVQPIDAYVTGARAPRRFTMVMAITFAGVALVLAGVGVYGVVAYAVGRRAHEFGIRRALGAAPGAIIRLVLADAGRLAAAGVALGLAIALPASQWLRSLLFGVTARDPFAYAAALATLGAAMLAASWLPARRAAASPPMHILRHDG
jgi:ABC-type antimicrobial peptide transport system permease subunit